MTYHLHDFISDIREADTPEDEHMIIKTELAEMRTMIRDCHVDLKPRIIAKLVYLSIWGENTSWGQIEAVSLMSHELLSYKRVGYLAGQTILDETNDMVVLITQTLMRDLQSASPLVQALPLSFVANKGTRELCQALAADVERLTGSMHPGIMKRAGMAAVMVVRKLPELAATFKKALNRLLACKKHGVVSAGILLAMELIKVEPELNRSWSHFAPPFTQLLRSLSLSRPTPEFRMSIFNDPFLQIKTMQLLGLIRQPSDDLDDALTSIVTAVDIRRSTGRAILFQTVETIGLTAKKPSLCGLAFNQIGRLLNIRQPNVLYSALSVFAKLLYNGQEIINRSSRESLALKRYKSQVVHCLDHRDPSIRRRALDVVSALIDESNVETLVPEIIDFLHLADRDFRAEMVAKIYSAVQRFAPTPMWNFDIIHMMIIDSGNYIGNDIITSFCKLIATNEDVKNHAIPLLSNTMYGYSSNQTLIRVASWVVGEYQQSSPENLEMMMKILKMPQTEIETKCYVMTAIAKLAARMNSIEESLKTFKELLTDNNIEIQQRAGELSNLLENPELWDSSFAPPEYKLPQGQQEVVKKATLVVDSNISNNLLDISEISNNTTNVPVVEQNTNDKIIDDLLDLGLPSAPPTNSSSDLVSSLTNSSNASNISVIPPPPNAVEALRTADFVIYFEIQKNAANPRQIAIRVTIANLGLHQLGNFNIQYGVPIGWIVKTQPLKNAVLQPRGGAPIQQILYLENKGSTPLMMKTHTTYMFGSQPLTSDDTLNPIFD